MSDKEMFYGFYEWAQGKESESYYIGHVAGATAAETLVLNNTKQPNSTMLLQSSSLWHRRRSIKPLRSSIANIRDSDSSSILSIRN